MKRCAVLIFSLLLVVESLGIASAQGQSVELNFEQAVAAALKQNLDCSLLLIDLEQAQAELDRALYVDDAELIEKAQAALEQAQNNYYTAKRDLVTKVRSKYYEVLQQEASVKNQAKALDRARTQLEIDQAKFEAGMISSLDLQRTKNSLANAQHSYESALITLETKYLEFCQLLGFEFGTSIVLTEEISVEFVPFELDLDQAYMSALDHDQSVAAAKDTLAKAIDAVKAADNPFTPRVDLEKARVDRQKAEIKLRQAEQNLYLRVRSEFYQVKNAAANVLAKERELELERQNLKAEEAKYAAGVISNQAVVAQQEKLAQAEDAYTQALWNYSQQRTQFMISIGMEQGLPGGVVDGD